METELFELKLFVGRKRHSSARETMWLLDSEKSHEENVWLLDPKISLSFPCCPVYIAIYPHIHVTAT